MKTFFTAFGLLFCAFTFTAFALIDWSTNPISSEATCAQPAPTFHNLVMLPEPPIAPEALVYNIAPRFSNHVTQSRLETANTILDILPEGATDELQDFEAVTVSLMHHDVQFLASESGQGIALTPAQRALLSNLGGQRNIHIRAQCKRSNPWNPQISPYELTYYMSIIPDQEAKPKEGIEALMKRLRSETLADVSGLNSDQLRPGKINFTVTHEGAIRNVILNSSSGYPEVDDRLMDLIMKMPAWEAATNIRGEAVDQQLVFFFGADGC